MPPKPQFQQFIDFIELRTPIWIERMGLTDYELDVVFLDSYFGDDGEEDFKISAVTESRPQYLEAKIKWFLPSIARHDGDHLEQTLVHELCHVLLSPEQGIIAEVRSSDLPAGEKIADLYAYQTENCTERTARILWRAFGPAIP